MPPKTQAALLEAMEEKQVTIEGITHKLPAPFVTMAPKTQLSKRGRIHYRSTNGRFLMKMSMGYPNRQEEKAILQEENCVVKMIMKQKRLLAK